MGRRAKKAPVQTKKRPTLAKRFKCPFCANEDVVECKMDFRAGIGSLACRLCGASYQMPIHHLHEPVDVFSEWLDDCEAAAQGRPTGSAAAAAAAAAASSSSSSALHGVSASAAVTAAASEAPRYNDSDDDDDDDDDDDEELLGRPSGLSKNKNSTGGGGTGAGGGTANGKAGKPSYTDLGLDDSDDDSEED